jgi:hypothetical protein
VEMSFLIFHIPVYVIYMVDLWKRYRIYDIRMRVMNLHSSIFHPSLKRTSKILSPIPIHGLGTETSMFYEFFSFSLEDRKSGGWILEYKL